jgi:hypothetical protein
MPRSPLRVVLFVVIVLDPAVLAAAACGGSQGAAPVTSRDSGGEGALAPTDSGSDVLGRDAGFDVAPGADSAVDPGAVAFCQASWDILLGCNVYSPACLAALFDAGIEAGIAADLRPCAAAWSTLESNGFLQVESECIGDLSCSCFTTDTCPDASIVAAQTCIDRGLATITPGAAAEALKADYCNTCPDDASAFPSCADFFSVPDGGLGDAGIDAAALDGLGFGSLVLEFSPSVLHQIDVSCTGAALAAFDAGPGLASCYARFIECVDATYQRAGAAEVEDASADVVRPAACLGDAGASGANADP